MAQRNLALEDASLKGRKLADDTRGLCASPGYLDCTARPLPPGDLKTHQLIAFRDVSARPLSGPDGRTGRFDAAQATSRT